MQHIAIFGGTFDPVHNGHIQTSVAIQSHFNFDSYYFLPCNIPVIKPKAMANNQQRIDMLQLALEGYDNFAIDLREIKRNTPSYMVDTLESFRAEYNDASITLIMGYDSFVSLTQWHKWEKIIHLANLLVINRSEFSKYPIPEPINQLLAKHKNEDAAQLLASRSGVIYLFDAGDYEISSTQIKDHLKRNLNVENALPKEVYEYIKQLGLYQ